MLNSFKLWFSISIALDFNSSPNWTSCGMWPVQFKFKLTQTANSSIWIVSSLQMSNNKTINGIRIRKQWILRNHHFFNKNKIRDFPFHRFPSLNVHMLNLRGPAHKPRVFIKRISRLPSWMGEVVLFLNQTSPLLGLADSTATKPDFHVWQWRYITCDLLCCEITTTKVRIRGRKRWPASTGLKSTPRGI